MMNQAEKQKTVVLVQGPKSADYWCTNLPEPAPARWICYDGIAAEILAQKKIQVTDDGEYFQGQSKPLKSLGDLAHQLSLSWFYHFQEEYPVSSGARIESFFFRTFNYCFLTVLRAFFLLDKIREREGAVRILTTDANTVGKSIRWTAEESPIPLLLRHCNSRWGFDVRFAGPIMPEEGRAKVRGIYSLSGPGANYVSRFRRGKTLFSGNPSLLRPVEAEWEKVFPNSSLRIKPIHRLLDFKSLFDSKSLAIAYPPPSNGSQFSYLNLVKKILAHQKIFFVSGTDLLPVLWPKVEYFYRCEASRAYQFYHHGLAILKRLRPNTLVVDEDVTEFHRALVDAANYLNIRTLVILHGLPGSSLGFAPLQANRIAVWGSYIKEVLSEWGIDPSKIVITGCPKYDRLCRQETKREVSKQKISAKLGWKSDRPIVLIVPGGLRENALENQEEENNSSAFEILKAAKYFVQIAREVPGLNFIFKFRIVNPQTAVRLIPLLNNWSRSIPNIRWVTEGLAMDYLQSCDLIFNSVSSAGLEAVLLKKPAVQMNFSHFEDTFPFLEKGLAAGVRTYEEALELCRKFALGKLPLADWVHGQERLVSPFLLSRDGKSSERVGKLLLEMGKPASVKPEHAESLGHVQA